MKRLSLIFTLIISFAVKGQGLKSQGALKWEHVAAFFYDGRETVMNHIDEATLQRKIIVYADSLLQQPLKLMDYKFIRGGNEVPSEINILNADDTLIRHGILFPVSIRIVNGSVWESVLKYDNSLKVYYRLADLWPFFSAQDSIMLNYMLHTGETFIDRNAMDVFGEKEYGYLKRQLYLLARQNKLQVFCTDSLNNICYWPQIEANSASAGTITFDADEYGTETIFTDSFYYTPVSIDSIKGIQLLFETTVKGLDINSRLLAIGPTCNVNRQGISFQSNCMFWVKPEDMALHFEKVRMDLYQQVFAIAVNEKLKK